MGTPRMHDRRAWAGGRLPRTLPSDPGYVRHPGPGAAERLPAALPVELTGEDGEQSTFRNCKVLNRPVARLSALFGVLLLPGA